ncbi:MAG: hypothetical protein ACKOEY_10360 [Phenylobacterium sp.]
MATPGDLKGWRHWAGAPQPPPAVNGRRIRPKYMAQTKARPPTFVLFASRADQLPDHYRRYLVHALRESFDLPGVPIRLSVRSSRNPFVEGAEPATGQSRKTTPKAAGGRTVSSKSRPAKPAGKAASLRPKTPGGKPVRPKGPSAASGTRGPRSRPVSPRGRPSRPGKT